MRVDAAAVNFPDVLLVAEPVPADACRPRSCRAASSPAWSPRSADDVDAVAVGDRVDRDRRSSARSPRRRSSAPTRCAASPTASTSATPPPSASPTAPRTTCSARWPACSRATSWSCSAPAAASAWPPCSSARCSAPSVTAVASSAEKLEVAAAHGAAHLIDHRSGDLRAGAAGAAARRRRRRGRPGGRRPVRAGAAVAAVGRALRHRRLRVGRRSRASRSTWCCSRASRCSASSSATSSPTPPDEFARNEDELIDLLASGRVVPHIGATFGLDEAAAALRYVADGRAIGKVVIDVGPHDQVNSPHPRGARLTLDQLQDLVLDPSTRGSHARSR